MKRQPLIWRVAHRATSIRNPPDSSVGRKSKWRSIDGLCPIRIPGFGQLLDQTWDGVGLVKTSDPRIQAKAFVVYVAQRYGTPVKGWEWKRINGWY